ERGDNVGHQPARDLLADLVRWQGKTAAATLSSPSVGIWAQGRWMRSVLAILLLAAVVVAGVMLRGRIAKSAPVANKSVTVLVSDFTNHTGDPIFDDTLEPMFNVALEGASFINAYSRGTARNLAKQLPHPSDKLDEQSARLIGVSQGLGAIVTGSLSLRGDGYKLSVEALDARTGKSIATAEITASTKDKLLLETPKLAAPIRKALGDTTPVAEQLA